MNNTTDIKKDSRDSFKEVILSHYKNISVDKVPLILLDSLCDKIADYHYDQYSRFRRQYPKSIKRYSSFQLKDLDHPYTKKIVVDFFKSELKAEYKDYTKLLLTMTGKELDDFEKWWYDFQRL